MDHTIQLPDELYHAVELYAAQRQQTPEGAILAWATEIQRQVIQTDSATAAAIVPAETPFDPWADFLTEATELDVTLRHDHYLAEEVIDPHESGQHRQS